MVFAVFGVGQEAQREHHSGVEVNGAQKPEVVSADVEHHHLPPAADYDKVGRGKVPPQRGERIPLRHPRNFDPLPER
jgi:hypothetical protein